MVAAQYEISLPADYDMQIIPRRVAERGSALDDRAGLGLKAYLTRSVIDGSPVNAYAPFYLWNDPDALAAFHWRGRGFPASSRTSTPDTHSVAWAIDPARWEAVIFRLANTRPASSASTTVYQVGHLSRPEIAALDRR